MKRYLAILVMGVMMASAVMLSSCTKKEKTVGGALIGAGTGAAIGSAVGNTEGAIAGGALGAVAGGLIGHSMGDD